MTPRTPLYSKSLFLLLVCAWQPAFGDAVAVPAATGLPAMAQGAETAQGASAVQGTAKAQPSAPASTIFPKITPRWLKWQLGVIADHARKNNWQPLPADSVRIVPYNGWSNAILTAFQVNLQTGEVIVLSGREDVPKIRSFKLQAPELDDLRKLLAGKPFADLATENQAVGRDGSGLLIESDQKSEYRWRMHWIDIPYPMPEVLAVVQKAYEREQR